MKPKWCLETKMHIIRTFFVNGWTHDIYFLKRYYIVHSVRRQTTPVWCVPNNGNRDIRQKKGKNMILLNNIWLYCWSLVSLWYFLIFCSMWRQHKTPCCFHGVLLLSHIDPASWSLAFVSGWCLRCLYVCPLFLVKGIWHLAALMFRAANLKTIGKAGTGW